MSERTMEAQREQDLANRREVATVRLANAAAFAANMLTDEMHEPGRLSVRRDLWNALDEWRELHGLPDGWPIDESLAIPEPGGEAGGDSTDCPTCGDELAVYWEEGRIRGVVSLDQPARAALLRAPRGEGERGLIMRAMLETFPWSPDIRQEHFERATDAVIAALRSEAQGEDELAALVVHMWQLKEQRGPMYTESGDFYADLRRAYELAAARTTNRSESDE